MPSLSLGGSLTKTWPEDDLVGVCEVNEGRWWAKGSERERECDNILEGPVLGKESRV